MTSNEPVQKARVAVRVVVHGHVQGVGFRAWTVHEALRRGLEGFVRNCRDGSVEALFVGDAETVAAMLAACRRGPPSARVTGMLTSEPDARVLALQRPGERFSSLPTV